MYGPCYVDDANVLGSSKVRPIHGSEGSTLLCYRRNPTMNISVCNQMDSE